MQISSIRCTKWMDRSSEHKQRKEEEEDSKYLDEMDLSCAQGRPRSEEDSVALLIDVNRHVKAGLS